MGNGVKGNKFGVVKKCIEKIKGRTFIEVP